MKLLKRWWFWVIVVVILFSGYYVFSIFQSVDMPGKINENEPEAKCINSGGIWKEFANGCVDFCELERTPESITCIQALTMGCDCGSSQCWNGNSCENN